MINILEGWAKRSNIEVKKLIKSPVNAIEEDADNIFLQD